MKISAYIRQIFLVLSGIVLLNSCTEKEGDALVALSFQPSAMTVNEGRVFPLTLKVKYGSATTFAAYDMKANPEGVVLTSSREDVATVSQNGEVTAIASGQTVITATAGELTATCTVNVSGAAIDYTKPFSMEYIYLSLIEFPDANGTTDNTIGGQIQNIDVDKAGNVYALGVSDPATYVKRITPDGKSDEPMIFWYFGHGTGFSIEESASGVYLWISTYATLGDVNGVGGKYVNEQLVARVKYEAGKTYVPEDLTELYYVGGHTSVWPCVDYEHNQLAMYHADNSVKGKDGKIKVYNLSLAKQASQKKVTLKSITKGGHASGPLAEQVTLTPEVLVKDLTSLTPQNEFSTKYSELSGETQQMQGYCLYKDKVYWVSGRGYGNEKQPLTQVTELDLNGTILKNAENLHFEDKKEDLINAGISVNGNFEVEGIKIREGHVYFGYNWNLTPNSTYTARASVIKF